MTRRPFLFSAGYQFHFDQDPAAGLGYIIPYWVDAVPEVVVEQGDRTCILLPIDEKQWDHVVGHLKQIAPETICYLWSRDREEFRRLRAEGLLEAILGAREVRVE
ncbi:MAG: hypothetical protein RMJ54_08750 [Roseiflexaceae bacterium]|nr:hypothetical protein [Roseiflexus sp.]MDW8232858.1 hypothetical protein [Roseiflexaceae bacterium]